MTYDPTTMRSEGMLTSEREAELFRRHREGDHRATDRLVRAHLPLINKIAAIYSRNGATHRDLVQEGVVGFIQGLERFDPERGFRISTLCRWWIRAAVTDSVRANSTMMRIGTTATQKRIWSGLAQARAKLGIYDEQPTRLDVARLAEHFGADADEVEATIHRMHPLTETSLDAQLSGLEGSVQSRVDTIADERQDPTDREEAIDDRRRMDALRVAVTRLDARKRDIIERRYMGDSSETLEQLSTTYGITRERIRQLEVQALEQLGLSIPAALGRMHGERPRARR